MEFFVNFRIFFSGPLGRKVDVYTVVLEWILSPHFTFYGKLINPVHSQVSIVSLIFLFKAEAIEFLGAFDLIYSVFHTISIHISSSPVLNRPSCISLGKMGWGHSYKKN